MFVSVLAAFSALGLAMTVANPPEAVVVLGTLGVLHGFYFTFLALYLKHSPQPLV